MSIGFNINAVDAPNRQALIDWHAQARPAWALVMDDSGLGLCRDIHAASPNTQIIYRDYGSYGGDDGLHTNKDPEKWIQEQHAKLQGRYWCYAGNEPGFDEKLIEWTYGVIEEALLLGQPVVIFNLAVGNPQNVDAWNDAHDVLELACKYPDIIAIGSHEYFLGVPTSGFVGGVPTELRDGNGRVIHPDYTRFWPSKPLDLGMLWHCGRVKVLFDYCKAQGWNKPRVVITEHGADNLRDLEAWRKSLPVADGFTEIRGWHSLAKYWHQLEPDYGTEDYFADALTYLDESVYRPLGVEGQLIFSWTNSPDWKKMFDVSGSQMLLSRLAKYNTADQPAPVPEPPAPEYPHGTEAINQNSGLVNIRTTPSVQGTVKVQIPPGAKFAYDPLMRSYGDGHTWAYVSYYRTSYDLVSGWAAGDVLGIPGYEVVAPSEPPPTPPVDVSDLEARVAALEAARADLAARLESVENSLNANRVLALAIATILQNSIEK